MRTKKLVYGVGINDADYPTYKCPYHEKWHNMLSRCYSEKYQKHRPSYIGCSVCDEWLTFTTFKEWMKSRDWKGKQLDKDILIKGNRVYSPSACVFVSVEINNLLNDHKKRRGKFPVGVSIDKRRNSYQAKISMYGKRFNIGHYKTPEEASEAYIKAKIKYIDEISKKESPPVRSALISRVST